MTKKVGKGLRQSLLGKGISAAAVVLLMGSGATVSAQDLVERDRSNDNLTPGDLADEMELPGSTTPEESLFNEYSDLDADETLERLEEILSSPPTAAALSSVLQHVDGRSRGRALEQAVLALVAGLDEEGLDETLAAVMRHYYDEKVRDDLESGALTRDGAAELLMAANEKITEAAVGSVAQRASGGDRFSSSRPFLRR